MTSTFRYTASDRHGALRQGRIEAESAEAVTRQVETLGLYPIEIAEQRGLGRSRLTLPASELALGLRILADLVDSGIPIARALAALEMIATPRWSVALPVMRQAVHDGETLATALERCPVKVPEVVIGIIHAGERGSGLAMAIRSAADLSQQAADTRAAIRGALAYPILLATAGAASSALLVGVVLPRFAAILSDMGQSLPPTTRFVLAADGFAHAAALPALAFLVLAVLAWRVHVSTASGRIGWHRFLLAAPLVGTIREAAGTSRLCTALAALLESGVPVASALPHAARATADSALEARTLAARGLVIQGERLSQALAHERAVSPVAVRLIRTGEESGRLASLLAHAARLERERATRRVQSLVRVIEPAMIVGFGGGVALVASALLQALYSIRPGG